MVYSLIYESAIINQSVSSFISVFDQNNSNHAYRDPSVFE